MNQILPDKVSFLFGELLDWLFNLPPLFATLFFGALSIILFFFPSNLSRIRNKNLAAFLLIAYVHKIVWLISIYTMAMGIFRLPKALGKNWDSLAFFQMLIFGFLFVGCLVAAYIIKKSGKDRIP